jgi:hypothetical protein
LAKIQAKICTFHQCILYDFVANAHFIHSVELHANWGAEKAPELSGGPLREPYTFWQMHFHWGTDDLRGSEHTINNVSFPMEVHAVHFKSQYGSARNALRYPDGLAVVSFLYQVCKIHFLSKICCNIFPCH